MAKQMQETKGGLVRAAAIAEAVRTLIPTLKGKHARKAKASGDDFASGAMEGIVLAWQSWDDAKGPWLAHAYRYAEEYALREATKAHGVVQTNDCRRKLRYEQTEAAVEMKDTLEKFRVKTFMPDLIITKDGPEARNESATPAEAVASADALAKLQARIREVLADIDPDSALGKLAPEIVASWLNDGDNEGAIGEAHGFSKVTGYRAAKELKKALRDAVADLDLM